MAPRDRIQRPGPCFGRPRHSCTEDQAMLRNHKGVWLAALAAALLGVRASDAQQGKSPGGARPGLAAKPGNFAPARVATANAGNLQYVGGMHYAGQNRISPPVWHERREYRHSPWAAPWCYY